MFPVWRAVDPHDIDSPVQPLSLVGGQVPADIGEVWCACSAVFACGEERLATAMLRGDSDDPPALISLWLDDGWIGLSLPPAPDFVLADAGPVPLAKAFGRSVDGVFP